jgi:hypothetical protein
MNPLPRPHSACCRFPSYGGYEGVMRDRSGLTLSLIRTAYNQGQTKTSEKGRSSPALLVLLPTPLLVLSSLLFSTLLQPLSLEKSKRPARRRSLTRVPHRHPIDYFQTPPMQASTRVRPPPPSWRLEQAWQSLLVGHALQSTGCSRSAEAPPGGLNLGEPRGKPIQPSSHPPRLTELARSPRSLARYELFLRRGRTPARGRRTTPSRSLSSPRYITAM